MTDLADRPLATPAPAVDPEFDAIWRWPPGWRSISAVNQTLLGQRFIITGMVFFLIAGLLALLIRVQLAVPDNDVLGHAAYNQVFTMHGTMMMFLFAVPIVEGAAVYLLPPMLGARDLPFPRLSAYGYWCYLFGGVLLLSSFLFGAAPDGGWFAYPPLTDARYSPGVNMDFWLLGLTFIEISAITAAIELIAAVLRTRAPGMGLDRMPLFAWYVLVAAFMILLGFPPLILGAVLLELERAFDWPFFEAARGGHPLLWQHLFWLFGHPEVYIILLPAVGMAAMVVSTFARTATVGYIWFVLAAVGTGFLSFGLWVHHMYATGIPQMSLAFFSAASMMVAIPSGIQIFGLIATLGAGRPVYRTPLLFVLGFIVIFVIGGFTGVMVAVVPFDLVVHDTQFVVAHFHYVLIGGVVFPVFAALYYWWPLATGRRCSERLGIWACGAMFAGLHLGFFPLHHTGLMGMPRRVFTYPAGLGWEWTNLLASLGAGLFAAGVLLALGNLAWAAWRGPRSEQNPWQAGTLEWVEIPTLTYNVRSIPAVEDRNPLWRDPGLPERIRRGELYLADSHGGRRLTLGTSAVEARLDHIMELPGPTFIPLVSALCTGLFFIGLLGKVYALAAVGGLLTVLAFLVWMWPDPDRNHPRFLPAGCGAVLPLDRGYHRSTAWSGLLLTLASDATLYASLVFSYIFLWSYGPHWPPLGLAAPEAVPAVIGLGLLLAGSAAASWAQAGIARGDRRRLMLGLIATMGAGLAFLLWQGWEAAAFGVSPRIHAFASLTYVLAGYQALHVAVALLMLGMAAARAWRGDFAPDRHVAVRIAATFWHYTVLLWIVGYALIYLSPRLLGP